MSRIAMVGPDPSWAEQYERTAQAVREILGELAQRVDHIGSTAVPGLVSKDVLDIQVTVGGESELDQAAGLLAEADWESGRLEGITRCRGCPARSCNGSSGWWWNPCTDGGSACMSG